MTRVVAAIIEQQGRLLICQRQQGKALAGKWEFPGGKMRPSETPRQALVRELREELAIDALVGRELYRVRHRYAETGKTFRIAFFHASVYSGIPQNRCFQEIRWVPRNELLDYDFLAANRFLIDKLACGRFAIAGSNLPLG